MSVNALSLHGAMSADTLFGRKTGGNGHCWTSPAWG